MSCPFEGITTAVPAKSLPTPGRCELAYEAYGSMKLRVAVRAKDESVSPAEVQAAEEVVRRIEALQASMVALAGGDEAPDAVLLVGRDGVYLRQANSADDTKKMTADDLAAAYPAEAFGPFEADATRGSKLVRALEAMAKATNLRRLATDARHLVLGADVVARGDRRALERGDGEV